MNKKGSWPYNLGLALMAINLLDGFFTIFFVGTGLAREMNPIMRILIEVSPWLFLSFKIFFTPFFFYVGKYAHKIIVLLLFSMYFCNLLFQLLFLFIFLFSPDSLQHSV